jgi:hypothetical protein
MPRSTYHLEIDGVPSCASPRHPLGSPIWSCAQSSHREAQREALLVWRDHPDAVIAIREGPCPRPGYEPHPHEEWDDYEP